MRADRIAAAAIVATIAFAVYTRTLLPGVDLGDTGGFQAAVLWPATSARQAYPLYYDLATPFVATVGASNPARALNLFSALWGGIAAGLLTWIVAAITASAPAGAAAGLLLAFSYTFWSQAIIAEVYTLHLSLVGLCLVALHGFAARPTRVRLALFFAVYALAFGNHLSMVLLLVPFTVFLLRAHPNRRDLFAPAVIAMAVIIAIVGTLQYTPNVLAVGSAFGAPHGWTERLADFWFDTTKADWRETMVLGVGGSQLLDRLAMWGWDARQQFGLFGLALAAVGAVRVWTFSRPWALLVWSAYVISTAFAFTYNVGDTHVFFLPSHYFTALLAGIAVAPAMRVRLTSDITETAEGARHAGVVSGFSRTFLGRTLPIVLLLYAGWRAWDTWPALDRHDDRRAEQLVARVAAGVSEDREVLVSQMDWQSENALLYSGRWQRRDLAWTRLAEVLPHFPFFVSDNRAIGRDVVLAGDAAAGVVSAYGELFPLVPDEALPARSLVDLVASVPRGSIYVLCLLRPSRETAFDPAEFQDALEELTGHRAPARQASGYEVWAGVAGDQPASYLSSARPFRTKLSVLGEPFDVRMDSWLSMDTFRRAGFGHVVHRREHSLIVERGVSLLWFPPGGGTRTAYAAGLYAERPRFRIPAAMMSLAALPSAGDREESRLETQRHAAARHFSTDAVCASGRRFGSGQALGRCAGALASAALSRNP